MECTAMNIGMPWYLQGFHSRLSLPMDIGNHRDASHEPILGLNPELIASSTRVFLAQSIINMPIRHIYGIQERERWCWGSTSWYWASMLKTMQCRC